MDLLELDGLIILSILFLDKLKEILFIVFVWLKDLFNFLIFNNILFFFVVSFMFCFKFFK